MKRIQSIDVFRGFTVAAMVLVNNPGDWSTVYEPLLHAKWHGLTPTDLIFPFFIFIVGISISLAYNDTKPSKVIYRKILTRSLKLFGLGLFLNWFITSYPFLSSYSTLRILGVLQRIGIVFFVTSILYLNCSKKALLLISVLILVTYNVLLGVIPLPNGLLPSFDRVPNNWANYIDVKLLGNHLWKPDYDPEGILSTIPTIVSCLAGIFIGEVLKIHNKQKLLKLLCIYSLSFLALGYIWNSFFPINKSLWTSSFVLVTAGWASLFVLVFYYLCDIKQTSYVNLFTYVGMNAIGIYFLSSFISKVFYLVTINNGENVHSFLYSNFYNSIINNNNLASLCYALTVLLSYILLSYILFKRKIFFKV
ncbi:heparan-alpha-glucosaminide N-acetyltransferase [Tenacibaculum sp. SZ-18]|uniref:acyltransferase family protein n=1 Tax=Tenacibaculum sp. SZ-18 TaxID=754423 RepID=UPI000C2CF774|nr:heparan-alpha-glucosaminide N-acetyltransferase domain-containing protein [Tenacibaculum sp. SZ-18]AUC13879.1 heparan-alpha-glucosaminide N-acetyltransferase [Tenacibaculum sp. SZ-18]